MNNLSYQIYLTKGREIFLIISLSYYNCHLLHFSITPSNIYYINSKTTNSEKAKSPKINIHSISFPTKYLIASKFILTIYRNFQSLIWKKQFIQLQCFWYWIHRSLFWIHTHSGIAWRMGVSATFMIWYLKIKTQDGM